MCVLCVFVQQMSSQLARFWELPCYTANICHVRTVNLQDGSHCWFIEQSLFSCGLKLERWKSQVRPRWCRSCFHVSGNHSVVNPTTLFICFVTSEDECFLTTDSSDMNQVIFFNYIRNKLHSICYVFTFYKDNRNRTILKGYFTKLNHLLSLMSIETCMWFFL